jgi:NADH-quinone oxidoreductase subunit L
LAGFWSKDELLVVANETHHTWLFVVFLPHRGHHGLLHARMVLLTFFGEYKGHAHPHESPPSMTGPLIFLAICTAGAGLLGAPQLNAVFGQWVFFEAITKPCSCP